MVKTLCFQEVRRGFGHAALSFISSFNWMNPRLSATALDLDHITMKEWDGQGLLSNPVRLCSMTGSTGYAGGPDFSSPIDMKNAPC